MQKPDTELAELLDGGGTAALAVAAWCENAAARVDELVAESDKQTTELLEAEGTVANLRQAVDIFGKRMTYLENLITQIATGAHNYKALSEALDPNKPSTAG